MVKLGYKLMSEEHGPTDLVRNARRAEQAGFEFAAISDHFSPWLEEQGHAPFAWSVLGALANATQRIGLMTAVTCPTVRYHPAVVAQAAATVALLSDNRFTLGLGAGERLNEHVVGRGWPGARERRERLSEAIDIIQGLLSGTLTSYRGDHFRLDRARLFDRPDRKPAVVVAAGGPEAARLAGRKGDGLVATEPRVVEAYRSAGGSGPRYAEVALCHAATPVGLRGLTRPAVAVPWGPGDGPRNRPPPAPTKEHLDGLRRKLAVRADGTFQLCTPTDISIRLQHPHQPWLSVTG